MDSPNAAPASRYDGQQSHAAELLRPDSARPLNVAKGPLATSSSNRQRPRVTRACDRCKLRKMRCTGKHPCNHCTKMSVACEYKAKYTRGQAPAIESALGNNGTEPSKLSRLNNNTSRLFSRRRSSARSSSEQVSDEQEPDDELTIREQYEKRTSIRGHIGAGVLGPLSPNEEEEHRASNRPFVLQYPSATVTSEASLDHEQVSSSSALFEQTQQSLHHKLHQEQMPIFSYGDPPLPEVNASLLVLPQLETAKVLVQDYFDIAVTNRFLHRPTLESWMHNIVYNGSSGYRHGKDNTSNNSKRAVVLLVFASAHDQVDSLSDGNNASTSFYFYQAAENALKAETGPITLPTIQARLLQCYFLLGRGRINQAYSIFGIMVTLAYAFGLHRNHTPNGSQDLVEIECNKRVFWSIYVMDKYLSSSLGRPQMLREDDTDQEHPKLVEDVDLSSTSLIASKRFGTIQGNICHIKLAMILEQVLSQMYSVKPKNLETRIEAAEKLEKDLDDWYESSSNLEPSIGDPTSKLGLLLVIVHVHAQILLYRPFLLDHLIPPAADDGHREFLHQRATRKVEACLQSATVMTALISAMSKKDTYFSTFWFAHFCGYCAIVVLYVYVIKHCSQPASTWAKYFEDAKKCQEHIKVTMGKESFAWRCSSVLDELKAEAVRSIQKARSGGSGSDDGDGEEGRNDNDYDANEGVDWLQHLGISQNRYEQSRPPALAAGSSSWFAGQWNDMTFDQMAPGGGILGSLFNGVDGIRVRGQDSIVERIDRWGFSSLTGY